MPDTAVIPVLTRKMRSMFALLDADRDGFLCADDLTAVADRMDAVFPGQAARIGTLRSTLHELWQDHLAPTVAGAGRLDVEAFELGIRRSVSVSPVTLLETLHEGACAWLSLCDTDGNGLIDLEEYQRLNQAIGGLPAQQMEESFRRLDRDGDGTLDPAEIDAAVVEFFTSEDPEAPGNWLYGPF
ncbi:EF-hand domain-containing protein [Streptomyces sp. NBC_01264]|uniref:EF-hand domain-containing protein n=1 Tax=Streptomyces sp. NBC_01264 TaxID=2903804 RepID=UPI0022505F3E|nr:EF-hand domain-containing protein [Streptomyces sp. NBC_01264]MCX4783590.1 EF-hand domain-containing protein [Streptomyces sp. NBC_01264]